MKMQKKREFLSINDKQNYEIKSNFHLCKARVSQLVLAMSKYSVNSKVFNSKRRKKDRMSLELI